MNYPATKSLDAAMAISRRGRYLARDGYRIDYETARDQVWFMASRIWAGIQPMPDQEIYIDKSDIDIGTTDTPTREQTRIRIAEEYVGIGCQKIPRPHIERLAFDEGWEFPENYELMEFAE